MLFHVVILDGRQQFDLDQGQIIERIAFDVIYIVHLTNALFEHIRHFQFHLVCRSSRIDSCHHRQLHLDFRIFQLTHLIAGQSSACQQNRNQKIDQVPVLKSPFAYIHHNSPPTFVLEPEAKGRTLSPSSI